MTQKIEAKPQNFLTTVVLSLIKYMKHVIFCDQYYHRDNSIIKNHDEIVLNLMGSVLWRVKYII